MTALLPKTEAAFEGIFGTAVTGTFAVYTGKGNEDKAEPCIIIEAGDAEEMVLETGNYSVPVTVTIKWKPGTDTDSLTDSNTATGLVHEALFNTTLSDHLSTATDFTCFGIVDRQFSAGREGDCWIETATLTVACCASDV